MGKGYKDLKLWEKAHKFAIKTYRICESFPREEVYGLTSQLKRAVFSIPTNIVEGHASNSKKEFLSFLNIANRSLVEVEYLLEVVAELGFIPEKEFNDLESSRSEVAVIMSAFIKAIRSRL